MTLLGFPSVVRVCANAYIKFDERNIDESNIIYVVGLLNRFRCLKLSNTRQTVNCIQRTFYIFNRIIKTTENESPSLYSSGCHEWYAFVLAENSDQWLVIGL